MNIEERIKLLCNKTSLSISEIGRRLNKSPQAFSQKIKRGNLTVDDLQEIANAAGCKFECSFHLPNGEIIEIK